MWFDTSDQVARVVLAGAVGYVALVLILRWSGKRTLAKLNAFDFVVTIALGSTLATIALSSDVSIAEGVVALALLVLLQFAIAWLSVRSDAVRHQARSHPVVLVRDGEVLDDPLRAARLSHEEIRQAVRSSGIGGMELVGTAVLETDGTISVITRTQLGSRSALDDVRGVDEGVGPS
jgi:uncharacterized membrane protein YcaP (DUF421 family)